MREQIAAARAELVSKFSESAQRRRKEITIELRGLLHQSFELRIGELRRLVADGHPYQESLTSACLVLQNLKTDDIRDPLAVACMGVVLDAGQSDAKRFYDAQVLSRMNDLDEQALTLAIEDLDLTEGELKRIALETGGKQGRNYTEAACLVRAMREQIATPGTNLCKPGGVLGMIMDVVQSSAATELQTASRSN